MLRARRRLHLVGLLLIMVTIRQAVPADLPAVLSLLRDSGLPHQDVSAAMMADYLIASEGDGLLGTVGIETYGGTGLLRSLAVRQDARSARLGSELCGAMERHALRNGVASLYLLTTTAEGFFARRGYRVVDRSTAPAPLQSTTEFAGLCPSRAVCMLLEPHQDNPHER